MSQEELQRERDQLPADAIPLIKAAEILSVHPATIQRWIHQGRLPAWRVVGRWRVSKSDVLAIAKRHRAKQPLWNPPVDIERRSALAKEQLRKMGMKYV